MPGDPYTILGVSKSATADEIKRAYRKQAHKYHPDKKGGDEAKFKEANEAYQTLSDPQKKAGFDQFGHAGAQGGFGGGGNGAQGFNFDMGDIFNMFSGGGGEAPGPARHERGEDLHLRVAVSKKDVGKRKIYEFDAFDACDTCSTSGVAPGSKMNTCSTCKGQGRVRQAVRTPFGTFANVVLCRQCEGQGSVPEKKCTTCGGTGREKTKRKVEVHIPKDLPNRYHMAFPQGGNAGQQGTPPGDLTIELERK